MWTLGVHVRAGEERWRGQTPTPFRYDLNQIPYDYTVEMRNRFKGLDLKDRVSDELWVEVHDTVQETWIKTIPKKKKCKKAKWLSEGALQIAEKIREAKRKGEKERYSHLNVCPTFCNLVDYSLPGSSVHGDSPDKNTGVGCLFLLQGMLLFFSQLFVRPPQTTILSSCVSFSLRCFWSLSPVQCHELPSIVLQALCLSNLIP